MAEYDPEQFKLTIKLVYYGPALSGKTTNLVCLHDKLQPELKGDMMIMETKNDRTLFFDLLPVGFNAPSGLLVKFKLFTVPGQVVHDSTRKAVLSRADGVIFVADSQHSQSRNNAESFEHLSANAARVGLDFEALPLVIQFNKRDLSNILSEEEVVERWRATSWPLVFSSALLGKGVVETFTTLLEQVYSVMDEHWSLLQEHGLDREQFLLQTLGRTHPSSPGPAPSAGSCQ
ncbi:gliding motility protein MglA [hydrothermal vent metagenome]|uniref:Gliding motility protein MglA n=1 Tax=hydrothermal vent metagenome TaxID=652676 RepID=A0A3B1AR52_9ZZZZ